MIVLVQAELRKCWKTRKMIIAMLCFSSFMGCAYLFSMQRNEQTHQIESMQLGQENMIAGTLFTDLEREIQNTPESKVTPKLRARFEMWKEAGEASYDYSMLRQAPEYFGWDKISAASLRRCNALQDIFSSEYYQGEFDNTMVTKESVERDIEYFNYLKEHNLQMSYSIYEPNLCNFIMQIFQNETMVLLIIISAFFLVDQLCQDFDYGSYKNIYITPKKRTHLMIAKVLSSLCMNAIAFVVALALFSIIPLSQHGFGSLIYPYMLNGQMILFITLFMKTMGLMLLVLLFYLSICVIGAVVFKNTTNTLLLMSGLIVFVYLCFKLFGMQIPILSWIPLFYLFPYEIITNQYMVPLWLCITICIVSIILMYIAFHKYIETSDLEGSAAS